VHADVVLCLSVIRLRRSGQGGRTSEQAKGSGAGGQLVARAYREHGAAIFRYLLARTHSVERAEDLTQEVFVAATAAAPRLVGVDRPLLPWLYTVARHRYADEVRRRSTDRVLLPLDTAAAVSAPEPAVESGVVDEVRRAIRALPPAQRRICALRLLGGRSFAEIEAELGTAQPACRMQCVRGLRRLRELLEQAGLQNAP
jgi:RNA polymerase sigma-70 factor, ECF subfamily